MYAQSSAVYYAPTHIHRHTHTHTYIHIYIYHIHIWIGMCLSMYPHGMILHDRNIIQMLLILAIKSNFD
jgi:hypothetical protein